MPSALTQWAAEDYEAIPISLLCPTPRNTTSLTGKESLFEEAERIHEEREVDFPTTFDYFFTYGYVFKTPKFFLMAEEALHEKGPLWLVWYAGNRGRNELKTLLSLMPYELPYIAFSRISSRDTKKLHIYETSRIKRILQHE